MTPVLDVSDDGDDVVRRCLALVKDAIAGTTGELVFCLSGGATPRPLYVAMAQEAREGRLPIARIHWVLADERFVPQDHPRSNFAMIRECLFDPAEIPASHVHAVPTERATPAQAAQAYEVELQKLYGATEIDPLRPLFDLAIMGLGEDGHTASLFPGASTLEESRRWVLPTQAPDGEPRITLTRAALDSTRRMAFLVTGSNKHAALSRWLDNDPSLPPTILAPPAPVHIFADAAAAGDRR